jgi:hypothetical protein
MRLLPDLLRLLRRLATDRALPRGVRIRLALLMAYLAIPIDVIPDFIPVLGYADDANQSHQILKIIDNEPSTPVRPPSVALTASRFPAARSLPAAPVAVQQGAAIPRRRG